MITQLASDEKFDEVKKTDLAIALHHLVVAAKKGFASAVRPVNHSRARCGLNRVSLAASARLYTPWPKMLLI